MSINDLEGKNTTNNVLTHKGTKVFHRRNKVKVAIGVASTAVGIGGGIGISYPIFHEATPAALNSINFGDYKASMNAFESQTFNNVTSTTGGEVTLKASGDGEDTNWSFENNVLSYTTTVDEKTTITITANDGTTTSSIKIDLLANEPSPVSNITFGVYFPSMEVGTDQPITAISSTGSVVNLSANGDDKGTKWTFNEETGVLSYTTTVDEKTTITITANDGTTTSSIKIDLLTSSDINYSDPADKIKNIEIHFEWEYDKGNDIMNGHGEFYVEDLGQNLEFKTTVIHYSTTYRTDNGEYIYDAEHSGGPGFSCSTPLPEDEETTIMYSIWPKFYMDINLVNELNYIALAEANLANPGISEEDRQMYEDWYREYTKRFNGELGKIHGFWWQYFNLANWDEVEEQMHEAYLEVVKS